LFFLFCGPLGAPGLWSDESSPDPGSPTAEALSPTASVDPEPEASLIPSERPNTFAFGTMDRGLGLSYERFWDARFAMQFQADSQNTDLLSSYGLGGSVRFYPTGNAAPSFYGGLRARVFEQSGRGNGSSGFYRGLRGGPQVGIRLPVYRAWVITYDLAWSWDLSLYISDPANQIGEARLADVQFAGYSGRITDAVSLGWTF
jgi:hypothetical protein